MTTDVSEEQAKVFRLWEELGGPPSYSAKNAEELYLEMTPTEQEELPHWPRLHDPKDYHYLLPVRFQRKRLF